MRFESLRMSKQNKVIITCAVTGAIHTPSMSPYLPVTPEEITAAAAGAAEAGAAIIHLHARDPVTGKVKFEIAYPGAIPHAGLLTTGGNVLFVPEAEGTLVAYDATNGKKLWSHSLGQGPNGGIISAVTADGGQELWRFETPFSPNISGLAVANGVVYFQSTLDGSLYVLEAATGDVLAQVVTGGVSGGPAVSRGQVYVGTGDAAFVFLDLSLPLGPGSIMALGLPD